MRAPLNSIANTDGYSEIRRNAMSERCCRTKGVSLRGVRTTKSLRHACMGGRGAEGGHLMNVEAALGCFVQKVLRDVVGAARLPVPHYQRNDSLPRSGCHPTGFVQNRFVGCGIGARISVTIAEYD